MASNVIGWTIVRHDAHYRGNVEFNRCVMEAPVTTENQKAMIVGAGGLVFPTYEQAEAFADKANYPPGHTNGIVANCQGRFANVTLDTRHIYIPVREVVG